MCKCGMYLIGEFRLLPSPMAMVFPAFKKGPDLFLKVSKVLTFIYILLIPFQNNTVLAE